MAAGPALLAFILVFLDDGITWYVVVVVVAVVGVCVVVGLGWVVVWLSSLDTHFIIIFLHLSFGFLIH